MPQAVPGMKAAARGSGSSTRAQAARRPGGQAAAEPAGGFRNPFSLGWTRNCKQFFCQPQEPTLVNPQDSSAESSNCSCTCELLRRQNLLHSELHMRHQQFGWLPGRVRNSRASDARTACT